MTAVNEGKRHSGSEGSERGCNTSYQIRDDVALDMVKQAVATLAPDVDAIVSNLARIVVGVMQAEQSRDQINAEKMRKELEQIIFKKKKVLDAFFSESISREDMEMMNKEYDLRAEKLTGLLAKREKWRTSEDIECVEREVEQRLRGVVAGETATDRFYGGLLEQITAYSDKYAEVALRLLPVKWMFALESPAVTDKSVHPEMPHYDTQVPISVSVAIPSLKGIE